MAEACDSLPAFPTAFTWGVATAAYQIEGGVDEGGRGRSVWDTFSHTYGKILTGDTGDVACDSFHRWPEDVALLRDLGPSGAGTCAGRAVGVERDGLPRSVHRDGRRDAARCGARAPEPQRALTG